MNKNRAVWVALIVLAVATVLMIFVVLPTINGNQPVTEMAGKVDDMAKTAGDVADKAGDAVEAAKVDVKSALLEKMGRLKADTIAATDELATLYAGDKASDAGALTTAKDKLASALQGVAAFKLPDGLDPAITSIVGKLGQEAQNAGIVIGKLSESASQALVEIDAVKMRMNLLFDAVESALKGETVPEASADAAAEKTARIPAFDILRVEKDGSTVIAGKAPPDTKVEIVDGNQAIASTEVNASGDFAAVLDKPLEPGDHQITLKATGKDGMSTTSEEVATVSVPKAGEGELLAMVTKPGEASRIITVPEVAAVSGQATADGVADAASGADATKDSTTAEIQTQEGGTVTTPDLPAGSKDIAGTAPTIQGQADQSANAAADAQQTTTGAEAGNVNADTAQTADAGRTPPEVQVSAVEIEGDHIFIAGAAKPGATVRVYADNKLIGEGKADASGRFVIDNKMPLSVGSHMIRADVLSADGSKVEFRAAVPFDRPVGEQVAVVADPSADAGSGAAMVSIDSAKLAVGLQEASKALALLNGLFADGKMPSAEELAAARSGTEIAMKSLSEMTIAGDANSASVAAMASKALELLKALPDDAAGVQAGLKPINDLMAPFQPAEKPADIVAQTQASSNAADQSADSKAIANTPSVETAQTTTEQNAGAKVVEVAPSVAKPADQEASDTAAGTPEQSTTSDMAAAETTQDDASGPKVIEQAPLKESKTSVIIRKGDTLWQISRRVYGRGVRYTTIYLANQDQISDPDEILPGQVFGVPETPLDNAEELHRKEVGKHHK